MEEIQVSEVVIVKQLFTLQLFTESRARKEIIYFKFHISFRQIECLSDKFMCSRNVHFYVSSLTVGATVSYYIILLYIKFTYRLFKKWIWYSKDILCFYPTYNLLNITLYSFSIWKQPCVALRVSNYLNNRLLAVEHFKREILKILVRPGYIIPYY